MSVEKFIISKNEGNFTVITNSILQGVKNYTALGLYCYVASLPHGWEFYKNHLSSHVGIGRDKLNKILKILEDYKLIHIAQVRNEKGQFAHFSMEVRNDMRKDFTLQINDIERVAQPFTEKPLTDNQLLVSGAYKRNKEKLNKKDIYCAIDIAHDRFLDFWNIYPKKKDKKRTHEIWSKKELDKKADEIIEKVKLQNKNEIQWKNKQFIPHPSTYLKNERWNDEIIIQQDSLAIDKKETYSIKANEPRSIVQEWGPGHPSWERNQEWKRNQREKPHEKVE